jgi:hypothetical protein
LLGAGFGYVGYSRLLAVVRPILLRRQVLYPLSYEGGLIRK